METIRITDATDARLAVFSRMTDAELRDKRQLIGLARATRDKRVAQGLFIAESHNVASRALDAGCKAFALISEERWVAQAESLARRSAECGAAAPLFVGTHADVCRLTGFERTRGPLVAFFRPEPRSPETLLHGARRVAILEDIANYTNLGAIFRSAAALGLDAVLVTPSCHDPLYRRAARVSMGTVFQVPWGRIGTDADWAREGIAIFHEAGFSVCALALEKDSLRLQDPRVAGAERLALVLGTEGAGLRQTTLAACDHTVMLPMAHGVDSLNVAATAAIAFWEVCGREL